MADIKDRIMDIIGEFQLSSLATLTTHGKPWTRYVMVRGNDDMTVRCATFVNERKVDQIKENQEVHITCGCTNPAQRGPYLQIAGRARMTTDEAERHALWHEMFSHVFEGPDDPKAHAGPIDALNQAIPNCRLVLGDTETKNHGALYHSCRRLLQLSWTASLVLLYSPSM